MLVLTYNAVLKCNHVNGMVSNTHSQDWITITQSGAKDARARKPTPVLIEPDTVHRPIVGCPNINVGIAPCLVTQAVKRGYSSFVSAGAKPFCLKSVTGLTDGSPGVNTYSVENAGQSFVECSE